MATTASTASAPGSAHCVSMIDKMTPSSAKTDPTERSMPPVMITMPIPMLKIPYIPIRRAMFCKFAGARKRGLRIATTMQSTTSNAKMPSSFLMFYSLTPPRESLPPAA